MYWRLAYGAVFLGLVFLASLSLPTPAAEATSQCGNITTTWPTVAGERDCDGFPDSVGIPNALASEAYLGTFPYVMCPVTPAQNDEPTDSWPPDFNDDQLVSGGDFLAFAPYFGQTVPPAPTRLNLNGDGLISGGDFLVMSPFYGKRCTSIFPATPAFGISRYMSSGNFSLAYSNGQAESDRFIADDLVVLDFGRPYRQGGVDGTLLPFTGEFASIQDIENAAKDYLRGFWYTWPGGAYLTLVIGTTNCVDSRIVDNDQKCPPQSPDAGYNNYEHGQAWANMINELNNWIDQAPSFRSREDVWGGSDFELDWSSASEAGDWANGYDYVYNTWDTGRKWAYIDYGTADGCSPFGSCNNGWTPTDVRYVAYGADAAWPIPEIYRTDGGNAAQWHDLAHLPGQGLITFLGSFTQSLSCQETHDPTCEGADNSVNAGWQQLWVNLNGDLNTSQPSRSLFWPSDISH